MMKAEEEWRSRGHKLSRRGYKLWRQRQVVKFNGFAPEQLSAEVIEERQACSKQLDDEETDGVTFSGVRPPCKILTAVVDRVGDARDLVTQQAFGETAHTKLGFSTDARKPGYTKYAESCRAEQQASLVVTDTGALPANQKSP